MLCGPSPFRRGANALQPQIVDVYAHARAGVDPAAAQAIPAHTEHKAVVVVVFLMLLAEGIVAAHAVTLVETATLMHGIMPMMMSET